MTSDVDPVDRPEGPTVISVDEQTDIDIDVERWRLLASSSLASRGVERGEMNLLFVDEAEMRRLNLEHMSRDNATDVLSFPLDGPQGDGPADVFIGDIVICPAYAARQAPRHHGELHHDGSLDDELALLVVHGVLHVLGWDHEDPSEAAEMSDAEQSLLSTHHRP